MSHSSCCSSTVEDRCPACGQRGRAVSAATVSAMLHTELSSRLPSETGFWFCQSPECEVVYYKPGSSEIVRLKEVRVEVFQKSTNPDRLVCYCFGHTVRAIQSEVRETGFSSILQDIKSKCAQGLDACERTNPQGSCCLGNVQRLVHQARGGSTPPPAGGCCCRSGSE
ncbi:MAG: hypothetical protein QHJ82_06435 [Verrucomicrobiota bacterium]|nr:hypothetical protein [Verrucomicrobiota bacterium]